MFEYPAVCLGGVWMPPVHTQHIESMLCHTNGVSICPHTFECLHMCGCTLYTWMPPYVWMAPCMFECCHMFGHLLYVCIPPCLDTTYMFVCPPLCLDTPVCLDAPYVLMHPLYVWMPHMFGCTPCMFGHPLYVWIMFGCPHTYTTQRKHALSH